MKVRFTKAQINILKNALGQINGSYRVHVREGRSAFSYPFRIFPPLHSYPPIRGFKDGTFNQQFMDKLLELGKGLNANTRNSASVRMDTFQIRAAVFAIRAYIDFVRHLRYQLRLKKHEEDRMSLHVDDQSFAQLKAKSKRVIHSLERHMKRANRALMTAVDKEHYTAQTVVWKAHLRWMQLHISYHKPWGEPNHHLRKQRQRNIDDLVTMAKRGIRNEGYRPADEDELRRLMRLYAKYARDGRQGRWTVPFLLANRADISRTYHLAHFVLDRLKLKELPKP
ncbi:hypothetical protein P8935_16330 [Telmatobacter sp. DSM 110680]|uniref:Uncharacterized protein n=1 Tax=Telmatobacter sp. DSM 110680 TaxID=3036704 RepID=A0AAU7DFL4_9BACT